MRRTDIISLKEAVYRTGKSEKTLRNWCRDFAIGRQTCPSAPIEVSAPALEMVIHGDFEALALLREGNRQHDAVRRYFDHLGIVA
jgi:hypothetical protein